MKYDLVCGLETHIELSTISKLFCKCKVNFGDSPNENCCPICIGAPGTLPILNRQAVRYAIKMGLALNCKINSFSKMERKCYFYPDLSKNFQTSQNDLPLCSGGFVQLDSGKRIRIHHMHIEEDAGKIKRQSDGIYVDYNRGGVPLIEIVSEPDISSADEAQEYIEKLQLFARYLRISSARMQEGSIRCDVNVSVKPSNSDKLGTRVEIKNMNSISFISKAISYEYERQSDALESGLSVAQETRRFNETSGTTEGMRNKENASEYCYFPEPNLLSICLTDEELHDIKKEMPKLFSERYDYYLSLGISEKFARLIIKYVNVSDYFDEVIKDCKVPDKIASIIVGPVFSYLKTEVEKEDFNISISVDDLKYLGNLIYENKISNSNAQKLVSKCLENNCDLKKEAKNFVSDDSFDLEKICKDVLSQNSEIVSDYKNGKEKAFQALIGKVMAQTKGRANAEKVASTMKSLI